MDSRTLQLTVGVCGFVSGMAACGVGAGDPVPFVLGDASANARDASSRSDSGDLKPRGPCKADETQCGRVCVDVSSSNEHCGSCANECQGAELCADNKCTCPATAAVCDDACVDVLADRAHCGGCDKRCEAWQLCTQGVCGCAEGSVECGSACVDLATDKAHCGGCDRACPEEASCVQSECACESSMLLACGDLCVDPLSSASHCGRCNRACTGEATCVTGVCLPPAALTSQCVAVRSGGHDYAFCAPAGGRSWAQARSDCQAFGLDLVIIDSQIENDFVHSNMAGTSWIGIGDGGDNNSCGNGSTTPDTESAWFWIAPGGIEDGTLACSGNNPCVAQGGAFIGFPSGQPDNAGCGSGNRGEDCAEILPGGAWNDNQCGVSHAFVCESY